MFEIGDLVTYAASGVCKISGTMENKVKGKKVKYLVLTPVYESSSKIYVPMDNEELLSRIGSIMSKEDIDSLIRSMPDIDAQWIDNDIESDKSLWIRPDSDIHSECISNLKELIEEMDFNAYSLSFDGSASVLRTIFGETYQLYLNGEL